MTLNDFISTNKKYNCFTILADDETIADEVMLEDLQARPNWVQMKHAKVVEWWAPGDPYKEIFVNIK